MAVPFSNTKLRVPRGFQNLLEGLAKEVLRNQPDNIYAFAAVYFGNLLKIREEQGIDPAEVGAKHEDRFYNNKAFTKAGNIGDVSDPQQQEAATTIQAAVRGHQTRDGVSEEKPDKENVVAEEAATKIQAAYRGYEARKRVNLLKEGEQNEESRTEGKVEEEIDIDLNDPEVEKAATMIQKSYRGFHVRKTMQSDKDKPPEAPEPPGEVPTEEKPPEAAEPAGEKTTPEEETTPEETTPEDKATPEEKTTSEEQATSEEIDIDLTDPEVEKAALKIQGGFRGMKTRKEMKGKEEAGKEDVKEAEKETEEKEITEKTDPAEEEIDIDLNDPEVGKAALKIQAGFRGYKDRKNSQKDEKGGLKKISCESDTGNEELFSHIDVSDPQINLAASKIQAGFKGMMVRNQLHHLFDSLDSLDVKLPVSTKESLVVKPDEVSSTAISSSTALLADTATVRTDSETSTSTVKAILEVVVGKVEEMITSDGGIGSVRKDLETLEEMKREGEQELVISSSTALLADTATATTDSETSTSTVKAILEVVVGKVEEMITSDGGIGSVRKDLETLEEMKREGEQELQDQTTERVLEGGAPVNLIVDPERTVEEELNSTQHKEQLLRVESDEHVDTLVDERGADTMGGLDHVLQQKTFEMGDEKVEEVGVGIAESKGHSVGEMLVVVPVEGDTGGTEDILADGSKVKSDVHEEERRDTSGGQQSSFSFLKGIVSYIADKVSSVSGTEQREENESLVEEIKSEIEGTETAEENAVDKSQNVGKQVDKSSVHHVDDLKVIGCEGEVRNIKVKSSSSVEIHYKVPAAADASEGTDITNKTRSTNDTNNSAEVERPVESYSQVQSGGMLVGDFQDINVMQEKARKTTPRSDRGLLGEEKGDEDGAAEISEKEITSTTGELECAKIVSHDEKNYEVSSVENEAAVQVTEESRPGEDGSFNQKKLEGTAQISTSNDMMRGGRKEVNGQVSYKDESAVDSGEVDEGVAVHEVDYDSERVSKDNVLPDMKEDAVMGIASSKEEESSRLDGVPLDENAANTVTVQQEDTPQAITLEIENAGQQETFTGGTEIVGPVEVRDEKLADEESSQSGGGMVDVNNLKGTAELNVGSEGMSEEENSDGSMEVKKSHLHIDEETQKGSQIGEREKQFQKTEKGPDDSDLTDDKNGVTCESKEQLPLMQEEETQLKETTSAVAVITLTLGDERKCTGREDVGDKTLGIESKDDTVDREMRVGGRGGDEEDISVRVLHADSETGVTVGKDEMRELGEGESQNHAKEECKDEVERAEEEVDGVVGGLRSEEEVKVGTQPACKDAMIVADIKAEADVSRVEMANVLGENEVDAENGKSVSVTGDEDKVMSETGMTKRSTHGEDDGKGAEADVSVDVEYIQDGIDGKRQVWNENQGAEAGSMDACRIEEKINAEEIPTKLNVEDKQKAEELNADKSVDIKDSGSKVDVESEISKESLARGEEAVVKDEEKDLESSVENKLEVIDGKTDREKENEGGKIDNKDATTDGEGKNKDIGGWEEDEKVSGEVKVVVGEVSAIEGREHYSVKAELWENNKGRFEEEVNIVARDKAGNEDVAEFVDRIAQRSDRGNDRIEMTDEGIQEESALHGQLDTEIGENVTRLGENASDVLQKEQVDGFNEDGSVGKGKSFGREEDRDEEEVKEMHGKVLSQTVGLSGSRNGNPEVIDIDLNDPEVQSAAFKIQKGFKRKTQGRKSKNVEGFKGNVGMVGNKLVSDGSGYVQGVLNKDMSPRKSLHGCGDQVKEIISGTSVGSDSHSVRPQEQRNWSPEKRVFSSSISVVPGKVISSSHKKAVHARVDPDTNIKKTEEVGDKLGEKQAEGKTGGAEVTNKTRVYEKEEVDIDLNDPEVERAALKIQNSFKGKFRKKTQSKEKQTLVSSKETEKNVEVNNTGATGKMTEATEEVDIDLNDPEVEKAALKIQSSFKGRFKRKTKEKFAEDGGSSDLKFLGKSSQLVENQKKDEKVSQEDEIDIDLNDPEVEKAALKIQSSFKGKFQKKSKTKCQNQGKIEEKGSPVEECKGGRKVKGSSDSVLGDSEVHSTGATSERKHKQVSGMGNIDKSEHLGRGETEESVKVPETEVDIDLADPEVQKAAVQIQAGFKKRKKETKEEEADAKGDAEDAGKEEQETKEEDTKGDEGKEDPKAEEEEEIDIDLTDPEVEQAAIKIQAGFKTMMSKKKKTEEEDTTKDAPNDATAAAEEEKEATEEEKEATEEGPATGTEEEPSSAQPVEGEPVAQRDVPVTEGEAADNTPVDTGDIAGGPVEAEAAAAEEDGNAAVTEEDGQGNESKDATADEVPVETETTPTEAEGTGTSKEDEGIPEGEDTEEKPADA